MIKQLRQYPSLLYQLVLINIIHQTCFFLQYNFTVGVSDSNYLNEWLFGSGLLMGVAYILGGWLVDFLRDIKSSLLFSFSLTFLSAIISFSPFDFAIVISIIFLNISFFISQISCLLNIGILFPIANDWKDHAFLVFLVAPYIILMVLSILLNLSLQFIPYESINGLSILLWVIGLGLLYFLVFKFNEIGYSIEESEEEEENQHTKKRKEIQILAGMILLSTIVTFASQNLTKLTKAEFNDITGLGGLLDSFLSYENIYLIQMIVYGTAIFLLFSNTSFQTRQIKKFYYFAGLMLGIGVFDGMIGLTDYYFIDTFLSMSLPIFPNFFIFPLLYSILTHIKIDNHSGLWLGLLLGVPSIIIAIVGLKLASYDDYISGILAFLIFIPLLIWVRENQIFLREFLALDEANRDETDEEENEDPFDHLVIKD